MASSAAPRRFVKICGVTSVADAEVVVLAGADAIGVNLWPKSSRHVSIETAANIARAVGDAARVVAVLVDEAPERARAVRERTGIEWLQLHGEETAEAMAAFFPNAFKAFRLTDDSVVEQVVAYPGDFVLVDAAVPGLVGGTGALADWRLAGLVAARRRVVLAGGLTPENVAAAIDAVQPWGVDVASGVEGATPREKSAAKVRAFVDAARSVVLPLPTKAR